jgi:hypothetical protein
VKPARDAARPVEHEDFDAVPAHQRLEEAHAQGEVAFQLVEASGRAHQDVMRIEQQTAILSIA